MDLSIILSFRNEEESIDILVRQISTAIESEVQQYEIVCVNDASTDRTEEILVRLKQEFPIRIFRTSRRFGVTPCLLYGLEKSVGNIVAYLDSDLQDPPELLKEMYANIQSGAEVVNTVRKKRKGENFLKILLTNLAYKIINNITEIPLKENCGDYKMLTRRAVDLVLSNAEYDPYMRGITAWIGFKQVWIQYERNARYGGKTKYSLLGSFNPYRELTRGITSYSDIPLYASISLGLITICITFCIALYALIAKLAGYAAYGSTGIILTICLIGSTILIGIGINGLYIGRILTELKGRARVIIEEEEI